MADEADMQATEDTSEASVETTTEDSQSETNTQDSNETSTEGSGENQEGKADKGDADQFASTGDKNKSEDQDSKKDSKPLSRRSAAYRIQQLVNENNELKKQAKKPVQQEQDEWEETPQEDEKPDISMLINEAVQKALHPVISESSKAADDAELSELFLNKPEERSKYESKIRSYWNLPQYKDVAAQDLYNMLRGSEIENTITQAKQQAIEEFKKAEREAKDSSASGSTNTSNRTGKGGKSIDDMTDEEFEQHNERVKAGQA